MRIIITFAFCFSLFIPSVLAQTDAIHELIVDGELIEISSYYHYDYHIG